MAFVSERLGRFPIGGGHYMSFGTFESNAGSTGGDVVTGNELYTEHITLTPHAAAVSTDAPVVNETYNDDKLPVNVTIVTIANQVGRWVAVGI